MQSTRNDRTINCFVCPTGANTVNFSKFGERVRSPESVLGLGTQRHTTTLDPPEWHASMPQCNGGIVGVAVAVVSTVVVKGTRTKIPDLVTGFLGTVQDQKQDSEKRNLR